MSPLAFHAHAEEVLLATSRIINSDAISGGLALSRSVAKLQEVWRTRNTTITRHERISRLHHHGKREMWPTSACTVLMRSTKRCRSEPWGLLHLLLLMLLLLLQL